MIPQILAALKTVGQIAGAFGKGMMGIKSASSPLALGKMGSMAGPLANIMKGANTVGQLAGTIKGTQGAGSNPLSLIKMLFGGQTQPDMEQQQLSTMAQTPFVPMQQQNVTASAPIAFGNMQSPGGQKLWRV